MAEQKRIVIHMQSPAETLTVPAYHEAGSLAVIEDPASPSRWMIVHVPTGKAISAYNLPTLDGACAVLDTLATWGIDWAQRPWDSAFNKRVAHAYEPHAGWRPVTGWGTGNDPWPQC